MLEKLLFYFQYPFVQYAFIVGVFISLAASLLGVNLVLKNYSFLGDGLSHVAFGAVGVASLFHLVSNMYLVLPVTILAAVVLLKRDKSKLLQGDAAIAMLSTSSLAFGYLLMNVFKNRANVAGDVCTTLFGSISILTLTKVEVVFSLLLSIGVVLYFVFFYNDIFAISFDENFAYASGRKIEALRLMNAIVVAIIVVVAMNLVGSLLVSALIVFPALSAMRVAKSFKAVCILSGLLSMISALLGIGFSILADTPVGASIVAVHAVVFIVFSLLGWVKK